VSDDHFLSRWSRRKHAAHRGEAPARPAEEVPAEVAPPVAPGAQTAAVEAAPEPLPAVESLTPESDFSPFMKPGVDPATKQAALKTLFSDPRFNVMDGLDVYIDDYSKPDPIPAEWMGQLSQLARLGDFRLQEAESPKDAEKDAATPQIAAKPEQQQAVGEAKVDDSSHTANKDETPPEVGQS
jgi:hypothetical protein